MEQLTQELLESHLKELQYPKWPYFEQGRDGITSFNEDGTSQFFSYQAIREDLDRHFASPNRDRST